MQIMYEWLVEVCGQALVITVLVQAIAFTLVHDYLMNLGLKEQATRFAWYAIERTTLVILAVSMSVFALGLTLLVLMLAPVLPILFAQWCFKYFRAVFKEVVGKAFEDQSRMSMRGLPQIRWRSW